MNAKITLAAAFVAASLSAPALAADPLNDLEIAHAAYTADEIDIRYAYLALAISENQSVHDFAQTMIRDHVAVNEAASALVAKLNVVPLDNELSQALNSGASDKRDELSGLRGAAFDCAYALNELGYHQVVNETVEVNFIPGAQVPELKELLTDALVTFKQHGVLAQAMVSGLNCGG